LHRFQVTADFMSNFR